MACKDCIHFESCKNLYETHGEGLSGDSYVCDFFKDRSRFVELPCKVGDFVYFIKARRIMADIVSKFTIDRCGVMLQRVNGYNLGYTYQLGKKIFLTREEAEQALKPKAGDKNT